MGCTYSVYGMVGVPLTEVLKTETRVKKVKKFHPDTGEPYMKDEHFKVDVFGGREIEDLYDFYRKNNIVECPSIGGFGIHSRGSECEQFIGITLEDQDIEYGGSAGAHSLEELAKFATDVKEKLAGLGCDVEPKVLFISSCSA